MSEEKVLRLADLRRDGGTQPRAELDAATVTEYAEAMAAGAAFPPVTVFFDGQAYWLADGFHRVAAAEQRGWAEIAADVRQGDRRAAVLHSTGVNADHGLRRTNADKRRAVDVLLRDAEWGQWSDREIARQCKVHHELVGRMRQELSGGTARYEAAGERLVTVQRAGVTYTMNTANVGSNPPAFATADEVAAAVRAKFAAIISEELRPALTQINSGSPAGTDYLTKLTVQLQQDFAPVKCRLADVTTACRAWLAELVAADRPAAKAVVYSPGENYLPIWELERAVRNYLSGFPASTEASRLHMVKAMITGNGPGGVIYYTQLKDTIGQPYRLGDLRQALHNVREQLEQAQAKVEAKVETQPGLRSAADVQAAAEELEPHLWAFLKLGHACELPGASAAELYKVKRLLASCLDLEGFHAVRGRNFDWEALVDWMGDDVDHDALRQALRVAHGQVVAEARRREAAAEVDEPDVISQWLATLVEENEIPATRQGEPERDAVRMILRSIINDRANGGARYYRSLIKHPAWPAGTDERAKLTAVRQALADLGGAVVETERRPPSWAGVQPVSGGQALAAPRTAKDATVALIARKDQHIRRLVVAVDKALGYLGSLAEQRNGDQDEDLLECISALRLARAEALNED